MFKRSVQVQVWIKYLITKRQTNNEFTGYRKIFYQPNYVRDQSTFLIWMTHKLKYRWQWRDPNHSSVIYWLDTKTAKKKIRRIQKYFNTMLPKFYFKVVVKLQVAFWFLIGELYVAYKCYWFRKKCSGVSDLVWRVAILYNTVRR